MNKQPIGAATPEQIAEWKKAHTSGIYMLTSDDGKYVAYFKNPSRQEVNASLASITAGNPLSASEELANLTFIGGAKEMLQEDAYMLGIVPDMERKMNGIRAHLVNL